jgi:cob(I)alamin adenosyltransferase
MKIYTRTGDAGETGLFGGGRVRKDHPRVVAYGAVDELNSVIGWALAEIAPGPTSDRLGRIQHDLFSVGAELATPPAREHRRRPATPPVPEARVTEMERWMDEMEAELPPLDRFVLPGGTRAAAALHVARTVCRRAEREVIVLVGQEEVDANVVRYLNRLSDLLFVCARHENARAGRADVVWEPDAPR